jgi:hypothetical protein
VYVLFYFSKAATGTGGYATTSNDGTSCGIDEDEDEDSAEERLRRRPGMGGASMRETASRREDPPSSRRGVDRSNLQGGFDTAFIDGGSRSKKD